MTAKLDVQVGRWLIGVYLPFVAFEDRPRFFWLRWFRVFVGPVCLEVNW